MIESCNIWNISVDLGFKWLASDGWTSEKCQLSVVSTLWGHLCLTVDGDRLGGILSQRGGELRIQCHYIYVCHNRRLRELATQHNSTAERRNTWKKPHTDPSRQLSVVYQNLLNEEKRPMFSSELAKAGGLIDNMRS